MSLYNESETAGNLWLRNPSGVIENGSKLLSAIYLKYSEIPNFYTDLINNDITRFDVFYDCLFIETQNGCFFEKIFIDENDSFQPFTRNYFFNIKKTTKVDYWFNENEQKIYFVDIEHLTSQIEHFNFILHIKEFDCVTGATEQKVKQFIDLKFSSSESWTNLNPIVETPKLTYNPNSTNYNVSFIFRNRIKQFALLSLMLSKKRTFEVNKIDGIVPFATLDSKNSQHYSLL
jgi:hypothetical protein